MAVYLGGKQVSINMNGVCYRVEIYTTPTVLNYVALVTSDGHMLADVNGAYITVKEDN